MADSKKTSDESCSRRMDEPTRVWLDTKEKTSNKVVVRWWRIISNASDRDTSVHSSWCRYAPGEKRGERREER